MRVRVRVACVMEGGTRRRTGEEAEESAGAGAGAGAPSAAEYAATVRRLLAPLPRDTLVALLADL